MGWVVGLGTAVEDVCRGERGEVSLSHARAIGTRIVTGSASGAAPGLTLVRA
jgi:hypothetical protein